jgi:hypothetical protein
MSEAFIKQGGVAGLGGRPKKKGSTVKLDDGAIGLMNEKGKRYRVGQAVIDFWNKCDGTLDAGYLIGTTGPAARVMLEKLKQLELLE